MWASHKINDSNVATPFPRMQQFVNEINACNPATPRAWMTALQNFAGEDNHDAWTRFYSATHNYYLPNVYEWFLLNPKSNNSRSPFSAGAYAGADFTTTSSTVTLQGEGKDNDGGTVKFKWTKVAGGAATFSNDTTAGTSVNGLTNGTYKFRMTVTSSDGSSAFDEVAVIANVTDNPPVVDAGPDQVILLPTSSANLNGSGSDDRGPVLFEWSKRSGPASFSFTNKNAAVTTVNNLEFGVYTFRLKVTDNAGQSKFNDMIITVNPPQLAGKKSWHSWNMITQSGASQPGKIISDVDNVTASMEFYLSTNVNGVAKGTLFPYFFNAIHPDVNVRVKGYWASTTGTNNDGKNYTYVGKSSVARGEEPGETNVSAPVGAFDVNMHPPSNTLQTVTAFIAPQAGTYTITNLAIRRVHNRGKIVELRVYDKLQQLQFSLASALTNQSWIKSPATTLNVGQLAAGERLYFAVANVDGYDYDMCEVTFTVSIDVSTPARMQTEDVVMTPENEEEEYQVEVFDGNGYLVRKFTHTATRDGMKSTDFRSQLDRHGLFIVRIRNRQNKFEIKKVVFMP
jgi:hypothetical protein